MAKPIIVVGAGISGITTALVLQLVGYETVIYAENLVEENTPRDPRFASLYPAASVIPHSVKTEYLDTLFPVSLQIFCKLFEIGFPGLKKHRHFEIFEFPSEPPDYTSYLDNFIPVQELPRPAVPHRIEANDLHGWAFDCFITEWPQYIHYLYRLYRKAGGIIHQKKLVRKDISLLSSDIIINCSGLGGIDLFKDSASFSVTRGHLLHLPQKPLVKDANGRICSYNYTPPPSIYATPEGGPCDVYFYPIANKWVLGGSRQAGTLNEVGEWIGKENNDTVTIDNIKIPRKIIGLNTEILQNTYQIDLTGTDNFHASVGYRFERNKPKNGLRLEISEKFGKYIIHNYGHGGAGVTLSWGCGLHIVNLLKKNGVISSDVERDDASMLLKSLDTELNKFK